MTVILVKIINPHRNLFFPFRKRLGTKGKCCIDEDEIDMRIGYRSSEGFHTFRFHTRRMSTLRLDFFRTNYHIKINNTVGLSFLYESVTP